jgi:hypothetical protein
MPKNQKMRLKSGIQTQSVNIIIHIPIKKTAKNQKNESVPSVFTVFL